MSPKPPEPDCERANPEESKESPKDGTDDEVTQTETTNSPNAKNEVRVGPLMIKGVEDYGMVSKEGQLNQQPAGNTFERKHRGERK